MIKRTIILLFCGFLSLSAFAADYPQYDSIGLYPAENTIRINPFKPASRKQAVVPSAQQSETSVKPFKDILSQVLVPMGIKQSTERSFILLGDRFYSAGDVMQVEILKDAQSYDSPAERVTLLRVEDKQFVVRIGENSDEVSLALPQIETVNSEKPGFATGAAKVTFLHREISVPSVPSSKR